MGSTDWDASLTRIIAGWLAKIVPEGAAINAAGQEPRRRLLGPIDSPATAGQLLAFLQEHGHAPNEIGVTFHPRRGPARARPDGACPRLVEPGGRCWAFRPRWASGARSAPASTSTMIEALAERYIYDETSHHYLDREVADSGAAFRAVPMMTDP